MLPAYAGRARMPPPPRRIGRGIGTLVATTRKSAGTLVNILNGGKHAKDSTDFKEF